MSKVEKYGRLMFRIAQQAEIAERSYQRMIGASWTESYQEGWRVFNEVYDLGFASDRPLETLPIRTIWGPQ
jgi:hypothetical protein